MADLHILCEGYIREGDDQRVGSSVGLVRDGDVLVVIDPGMVASTSSILDPIGALGWTPGDVTDVVISHHHPDHTVNVALFANARLHDHWAIYRHDLWIDRSAEGFHVSPDVTLLETPGHTPQDVTTLVATRDGVVAFTHLWWSAEGPSDDPFAPDRDLLRRQRERVLGLASAIVPGHGPRFLPDAHTPR